MPAATNEPNTNSRIRKVIGTVSRSAFWKSLPIVLFSSWFALARPNWATVKSRVLLLQRRHRVEHRLDTLVRGLGLAAHRELHERGVPVRRDRLRRAGSERRAHVLHLGQRAQLRRDARDRGAEGRVGDRQRLALDEDVLRGRLGEAGALEDRLCARRLARRALGVGQLDDAGCACRSPPTRSRTRSTRTSPSSSAPRSTVLRAQRDFPLSISAPCRLLATLSPSVPRGDRATPSGTTRSEP